MFAIIGIVVVFGCIVAGYLMEHGNLRVLLQPAELIIIGGAAAGTVLGVVITMEALGGPPEEIGYKVAAALVGTFLGILLCYGLVRPIASNMTKAAEEEHAFLYLMRVLIASFLKGTAPIMAVEVARRAVPGHVRSSFKEMEQACRG